MKIKDLIPQDGLGIKPIKTEGVISALPIDENILDLKKSNRDYYLADFKFEKLREQIKDFQDSLSDDLDVCIQLAAYGNQLICVENIGYQNPDILYFYGYMNNNKVQLIQHISQLNFMLLAMPKSNSTKQPNRIGFVVNNQAES